MSANDPKRTFNDFICNASSIGRSADFRYRCLSAPAPRKWYWGRLGTCLVSNLRKLDRSSESAAGTKRTKFEWAVNVSYW